MKGLPKLEVEEDELGIPVMTKHHVKISPRYSAVFEVNLHGNCEGTKIISSNKQLMELNPNVFQHEILIKPEGDKYFPVIAITNLDHAKMLHLGKGDVVGFAHDEEVEMNYIETANTLEMEGTEQTAPRNWIPERSWRNYNNHSQISLRHTEVCEVTSDQAKVGEISPNPREISERLMGRPMSSKILHKKPWETAQQDEPNSTEGFDTNFLISPGDIYPNRNVKLEDADIAVET